MSRKTTDFLKEPMPNGKLKLFPSLLVFCCSIFVNAYFQVTSFSALTQWFLKTSGAENVPENLAEIIARTGTPIGMRIAFGLLMTVFVKVQNKTICRKMHQIELYCTFFLFDGKCRFWEHRI